MRGTRKGHIEIGHNYAWSRRTRDVHLLHGKVAIVPPAEDDRSCRRMKAGDDVAAVADPTGYPMEPGIQQDDLRVALERACLAGVKTHAKPTSRVSERRT